MDRKRIAREIVEESVVLLKNDGMLPLASGQKVAFFGRSQLKTYISGSGSGAAKGSKESNILLECEKRGILPCPELKTFYQSCLETEEERPEEAFDFAAMKDLVNSGLMYEIFGRYHAPAKEYEIPESLLQSARDYSNTAVLVIGRDAGGEECDRHLEEDYELTSSEKELVEQVCSTFTDVALILNINGLIDLNWIRNYPSVRSILFLGIPGEEGASALAEILTGEVNPSGKLAFTIAKRFEDYPSARHFSWDKDNPEQLLTYESYNLDSEENGSKGFCKSPVTVYWEDIYAGYRYFDTFGKEPLFPFGFGLSYTRFQISGLIARKESDGICVMARVQNTGECPGKEVVQLYLSASGTRSEQPLQELKGFEKTRLLSPRETQNLKIEIAWEELAVYEEGTASYRIQAGDYQIRLGTSSRDTCPVCRIRVNEDILVRQCGNRLGIKDCNRGKIQFLTQDRNRRPGFNEEETPFRMELTPEEVLKALHAEPENGSRFLSGTCGLQGESPDSGRLLLSKMNLSGWSVEKLSALLVGYGPGVPFSAFGDGTDPETLFDAEGRPLTTNSHPTGVNGYVSPAMKENGILSVFYKDGPAGTGQTAWPSEMLMACAFNRKLWRRFGDGAGAECEEQEVDIWLAPAVNLQRNPLCGRNFEYFSEDPYLTGECACEITRGVQENHPVIVCPKHFAVNEQETFRRGNAKKNYDAADSIVSERAARELYLKPFEMLVRKAGITCVMTSFNKINGVFAGGNKDLCTHILREEWGFHGVVVTDWGDMDIVVDGADAVAAGNDVVMPGGPPVIAQILRGYEEGRVTRAQMETGVRHLLQMIESTGRIVCDSENS